MLGDDPTRRFDYLFEPLDGGNTIEDTDDDGAVAEPAVDRSRPAGSAKAAVAAIVLALAAATVALVMLLLRPTADGRVDAPVDLTRSPTPTSVSPIATSQPVPPPPAPTSVVDTPVVDAPVVETTAAPPPPPSPALTPDETTAEPLPDAPADGPPATRSPMSVEPQPRPAFPNQTPDYGSDPRGGLFGGGGLL